MMPEIIETKHAPAAVGPYSQGIATDNFVFFSGQIALTPSGDFIQVSTEKQLEQIFQNIEALLEAANLKKENVVKVMMFMTDISEFAAANTIYADFFGDHKPARSSIGVAALPLGATIEVEILAQRG